MDIYKRCPIKTFFFLKSVAFWVRWHIFALVRWRYYVQIYLMCAKTVDLLIYNHYECSISTNYVVEIIGTTAHTCRTRIHQIMCAHSENTKLHYAFYSHHEVLQTRACRRAYLITKVCRHTESSEVMPWNCYNVFLLVVVSHVLNINSVWYVYVLHITQ